MYEFRARLNKNKIDISKLTRKSSQFKYNMRHTDEIWKAITLLLKEIRLMQLKRMEFWKIQYGMPGNCHPCKTSWFSTQQRLMIKNTENDRKKEIKNGVWISAGEQVSIHMLKQIKL